MVRRLRPHAEDQPLGRARPLGHRGVRLYGRRRREARRGRRRDQPARRVRHRQPRHAASPRGDHLVLVGRDASTLEKAREELTATGRSVAALSADLETGEGAEALCDRVLTEQGPIDILVNNVGGRRENIATESMPLDTWKRLL